MSENANDNGPKRHIDDEELRGMDAAELEDEIRRHNRLYWEKNAPEISDVDYDRLTRRLRELAPESPALDEIGAGAPAEEAAIAPERAVAHDPPMLSLDKCYTEDELARWADKIDGEVMVTPKLDGVAAAIRYDADGRLALAATRGSGRVGENITENVRRIADVPNEIDAGGRAIEVRGEVYMKLSVFGRYKGEFSNPRNLTAGAIKQKEADKSEAYNLSFAPYDARGAGAATEAEKFEFLERLGFPKVDRRLVGRDELQKAYEDVAARRGDYDFEIDGVVYKANSVDLQESLGATAHHPRYAMAYKFQGDSAVTTLNDIEWSVSRTGAITPVALIEPVELSGAVVSRASLHNAGFIQKLDLTRGARVQVTRRGGVIPNVEFVVEAGEGEFDVPETCPSCGKSTRREDDFLFCSAPGHCAACVVGTLGHFVGVCEIEGFGRKSLTDAFEKNLLRSPVDFFKLEKDDLLKLERTGDKTAENLLGEIAARRVLPLETFLQALGIPELGGSVARVLTREYRTLERIRAATAEELDDIHTIGEITAERVVNGLKEKADLIDGLLEHITVVEPPPADEDAGGAAPLAGKSFVFTGGLEAMTRPEAQKRVRALGGETPSGVGKGLSYLVVGEEKSGKKSSKQAKAEKLAADGAPVEIVDEARFREIIEEAERRREDAAGGQQLDMFEQGL